MERRQFLGASLSTLALSALLPSGLVLAQPHCDRRTEPNIEGPFYRAHAPFRSALAQGLVISGVVRDPSCRPMRDAVIEVWQANAHGDYDLRGDSFRGCLRTDAAGAYHIETIEPGRYLNGGVFRPAHIHVKVHANGRPPLTTQLYFPGDPYADADPWFRRSLVLSFSPGGCCSPMPNGPRNARFDFVV
jgi:catechol 1,2-dioxygenase